MLSIGATIENNRVVIDDIDKIGRNYPAAVVRGIGRIVVGVNREAVKNLSGPGAKNSRIAPGVYPVPVRIGHLRRQQNFVKPDKQKSTNGLVFIANGMSGIVYNAAQYSIQIHEGRGSSKKYGKRAYITDAVPSFDRGGKIAKVLDEEVSKEL